MKATGLLAPYQRVTSGGRFIAEIDGLRFFAIMPVVLMHLNTQVQEQVLPSVGAVADGSLFNRLISLGGNGVYLFFIISGFILALPFAKWHMQGGRSVSLGQYFLRRLTRLEPPYLITMTLFFVVQVFMLGESFIELFPHFLASCGYLHGVIYKAWSPINPVAWSLEIEIQFYVLVPLLTQVFRIRHKWLRRLVILIPIIGLVYIHFLVFPFNKFFLPPHLPLFLCGFLLADIFLNEWKSAPARNYRYDLLFGIGLLIWIYMVSFEPYLTVGQLLAFSLLFIGAFRSRLSNWFTSQPIITTIGGMCYTIYLLHYPFIHFAMKFTNDITIGNTYILNAILQQLLVVPPLVIISAVFFRYFEKPFMDKDWPQHFGRRLGLVKEKEASA